MKPSCSSARFAFRLARLAPVGLATFVCVTLAAPEPSAKAEDDPVMQCVSASNKGLDLRKQGKLGEARQVLASCAVPSCGAEISAVCQRRVTEINAVMPSIVFLPKDGAGKDMLDVKMTVDARGSGVVLDGRPVPLDPGPHSFKFEVHGFAPVMRSLIVAEGTKDRLEIVEMAPPEAKRRTALGGTVPDASATSGSGQKTAGYWVVGAGVAVLAAGSVFGLMAASSQSTQNSDCPSQTNCPNYDKAVDAHNDAATFGTVSTIAFAVGGVAFATGMVLVLTAQAPKWQTGSSAIRDVRIAPSASPDTAGLVLSGVFE